MKFSFKIQQYQTDAVESTVRVFDGQPFNDHIRYTYDYGRMERTFDDPDNGYANNEVQLNDVQLLENIRKIQDENNIHRSEELVKRNLGRCQLDIEMETGTGKTYVYIKTIFELNKRYGWSKFIIVVPSIAIREGVNKSFQTMEDHFMQNYGKKARYFIYDSNNLTRVDDFSKNYGIQVMIINSQAFARDLKEGAKNKAALRIYKEQESFGYRKPIDVIARNHAIIIMDEPQKMGGDATQKALRRFNPLFVLNYSATHVEHHNLVYVLDALDAYNKRLVKRIEVKGFDLKGVRGTSGYIYVDSIKLFTNKNPETVLEIEVNHDSGIKRERHQLRKGDNLYEESNHLQQYKEGYVISDINGYTGEVSFVNGIHLFTTQSTHDITEDWLRRIQIRETIKSHLMKEKDNFHRGIKTLSLFFIDEVKKYKDYSREDERGEYQNIFEHEYQEIVNEYTDLFDPEYMDYLRKFPVSKIHNGYFSQDKNKHFVDSKTTSKSDLANGEDSISAYDLIMKDKERLLDFNEPTRFIFSHSALREGWDNPNIFQICTLRHTKSDISKRQEVGRGMRLCVDQNGTRMDEETLGEDVQNVNLLTVIANDSYETFVEGLQSEIGNVLYERPKAATVEYFEGKHYVINGSNIAISHEIANKINKFLYKHDYIDDDDKVTEKFRIDAANGTVAEMSAELQPYRQAIIDFTRAIYDESVLKNMFTNANQPDVPSNEINKNNAAKKEFKELWNRINHKYGYTVEYSSEELIDHAVKAIDEQLRIGQLMYTTTIAKMRQSLKDDMIKSGMGFEQAQTESTKLRIDDVTTVKYDLIGKVASGASITRRTAMAILKGIEPTRMAMFKYDPERFIKEVVRIIKNEKATMIVEAITYHKLEDKYEMDIFTQDKSHRDAIHVFKAKKNIQDYVYTDGMAENSVEKKFAEKLDGAKEVIVYAKLPKTFYIPTPVGNYSPDWAIAFDDKDKDIKYIYFIAETKGTLDYMELRDIEKVKIRCARKCFNECVDNNNKIHYDFVKDYDALLELIKGN